MRCRTPWRCAHLSASLAARALHLAALMLLRLAGSPQRLRRLTLQAAPADARGPAGAEMALPFLQRAAATLVSSAGAPAPVLPQLMAAQLEARQAVAHPLQRGLVRHRIGSGRRPRGSVPLCSSLPVRGCGGADTAMRALQIESMERDLAAPCCETAEAVHAAVALLVRAAGSGCRCVLILLCCGEPTRGQTVRCAPRA